VSARDWSDAHLVDAAREIHADDPVFGYRFIADELRAERGIRASENRVHRLCRQHGLSSVLARKRGRGLKPGPAVHDDLVRRAFSASRPNELWLTDITEHRTDEGKLYLCAIKDACSNRIVAYSIDERMKASLAVAALRNAVGLRSPQGTVVHSDRGSQTDRPSSSARLGTGVFTDRWAGSGRAPTTPRWSRSSRCCRRTCWTGNAGRPERSCA
jgi:putative transposase